MPVRDDWKSSQLWKALEARTGNEPAAVRAFLERWMPEIARVLAHGASSPPNFTLHDAEHSFRVAEWMARLMPETVLGQLSEYEIALLLLSAYLHDMGMTPELGKVRRHRDFLLTGGTSLLTDGEERRFQYWLDAAGYGGTHPCDDRSRPMDEVVRDADEIITGYTRHRHNDWSEEWIRAQLGAEPLGTYEGWVEDLVRLCRSHHDGYEELVGRRFDPRRVGSGAQVVHLRYLSALLRVSDVLDVDRERTPVVVFRHRDIMAGSETYWQKDADLTIHLEAGQLSAFARPPRAYLHRAVEETLDGIDRELAMCRRLADVTRFEKPVGPGADLPHCWILQPTLFRDVEARDGAYQYIDGAFRPNTRKLLELLSGTALYGDPLAAVRELLQNAFDAVRELIAYRRLRTLNPSDPTLEAQIGALLTVRLSMEPEGDHWWLVCHDDGVGMTQEIIRDALLVSGSPPRPEVLDLDRRCRTAGFRLGRTGQFGICALSYFMLADRAVLTTRRSNDAASAERTGWRFETSGVGSFGELRSDTSLPHGTEVRLRLRSGIVENPAEFANQLALYLRATLVHIPCDLEFAAPGGAPLFRRKPGWIMDEAERDKVALGNFHASGEETGYAVPEEGSPKRRALLERHERRWRAIRAEAAEKLRWATAEGDLPDGMGHYRLHLPYFEVEGGVSLAFIRPRGERGGLILRPVARDDYQRPEAFTAWGWKGFALEIVAPSNAKYESIRAGHGRLVRAESMLMDRNPIPVNWENHVVSAEVDFQSAAVGTLAVSRGWLELGPEGKKLVTWLDARARELVEAFISDHSDSSFALLNARVAGVTPPAGSRYEWALSAVRPGADTTHTRALRWGLLPFPITLGAFQSPHSHPLRWDGQRVSHALSLRRYGAEWSGQMLKWYTREMSPQRLVAIGPVGRPAPLWTGEPVCTPRPRSVGWTSEFPPEWQHISAASTAPPDPVLIWNIRDPVVLSALAAPERLQRMPPGHSSFSTVYASALESQATATIWFIDRVVMLYDSYRLGDEFERWNDLSLNAPDFLPRLWKLLLGSSAQEDGAWQPITLLLGDQNSWRLVMLSPAGALIGDAPPFPAASEWVVSEAAP